MKVVFNGKRLDLKRYSVSDDTKYLSFEFDSHRSYIEFIEANNTSVRLGVVVEFELEDRKTSAWCWLNKITGNTVVLFVQSVWNTDKKME